MSGDVLRDGVQDVVESELGRIAQVRGGERVVDHGCDARRVAALPQRREIGNRDVRVGDRLDVEELRSGECLRHPIDVVWRHEGDLDPVARQLRVEQRVRAAVELGTRHDAIAGLRETRDHAVDRRHTAREPVGRLGAFQVRHGVFERLDRGEYRLVRLTAQSNEGVVDWLLACPEKGFFVPIESESTDVL